MNNSIICVQLIHYLIKYFTPIVLILWIIEIIIAKWAILWIMTRRLEVSKFYQEVDKIYWKNSICCCLCGLSLDKHYIDLFNLISFWDTSQYIQAIVAFRKILLSITNVKHVARNQGWLEIPFAFSIKPRGL